MLDVISLDDPADLDFEVSRNALTNILQHRKIKGATTANGSSAHRRAQHDDPRASAQHPGSPTPATHQTSSRPHAKSTYECSSALTSGTHSTMPSSRHAVETPKQAVCDCICNGFASGTTTAQ